MHKDNVDRKPCRDLTIRDNTDDLECFCLPGKTAPCCIRKAQGNESERIFDRFNANIEALARCPFKDKGCSFHLLTLSTLKDTLEAKRANQFL